jgi:voltage-gated potassium channel
LQALVTIIWIIFLLEFALKFVIAPTKLRFLRKNWLTMLALALPALRVFRVGRAIYALRAARAVRGVTLARVLTAFNRGLGSMRATLGAFGFQYVIALTLLVSGLGAAGIYSFERRDAGGSIDTFGDALWFTAMLMTTSGSDYWPKTAEGRVLCFLLALYAFAVFGYVTATLASVLIGQNTKSQRSEEEKSERRSLAALHSEIARLHARLDAVLDGKP